MLVYQRTQAVGRFSLPDGQHIFDVDIPVEIEQLGSGSTFLFCCSEDECTVSPLMVNSGSALSFVGHTQDGLSIRTSNLRTYLGQKSDRHCFSIAHVIIGDPTASYASIELALTNFVFERNSKQGESLEISVGGTPLLIELVPAEDYDDVVFHLLQSDCPTVTAKLRMASVSPSMDTLDRLVDDLSATLSVIQGRKIQWIQRTAWSESGSLAWSEFGETKTKNYTHSLLCFDPDKRRGLVMSLDRLAFAFPNIRRFHQVYDPVRRIVNSWLDARLQNDFLEARTLKYAIVLEALCRLVESKHDDIPSRYVPKSAWRSTGAEFLPRIRDHLGATFGLDSEPVENVCSRSNWGNLNRAGFRTNLTECLQRLGISMYDGPQRIRRVTDVRNKIVHSLTYLTDDDFEDLNWPAVDATHQHFLVACFVDEALLRLFGLGDQVSDAWITAFRAHRPQSTDPAPP